MKPEIIIPILMMLAAIFYKFLYKLSGSENNPRNWHFNDEKIDKIVTLILRLIIFMFGLWLLICNTIPK